MSGSVITCGFLATLVTLVIGVTFGTLGGWEPILAQSATKLGSWILAGFLGIIAASIYTGFGFNQFLPGDTLVKGAIYGFLLLVVILIIGAFWIPVALAAFTAPFTGIILHLVWGTTLAFFAENWPK